MSAGSITAISAADKVLRLCLVVAVECQEFDCYWRLNEQRTPDKGLGNQAGSL